MADADIESLLFAHLYELGEIEETKLPFYFFKEQFDL